MALRRFYDELLVEQHTNQMDLEFNTSVLYYELMEAIKEGRAK